MPLGDSKSGREGYQNSWRVDSWLIAMVLWLAILPYAGIAQEPAETIPLAALAARADAIALVRVGSTDYAYRRGFPYRGSALLEVLIPYKGDELPETIEVFEEGLHPVECYFPDSPVAADGRRYLVFLARDLDDPERFRGMPHGCALDVLVTAQNRYALRMPLDGIALSDDLAPLAQAMRFADRYAVETEDSITPARRDALILEGNLKRADDRYRYTRGILLEDFRPLLKIELR